MNIQHSRLLQNACYIDGDWVEALNGATTDVTSPATGERLAQVPRMGRQETRRAIERANAAWPAWRNTTARARAALLRKLYELMLEHQEDLAQILTAEQGKPIAEARGEILYAASFIEWFAEEGKRIYGDTIPQPSMDRRLLVLKQPIGVVAAITPWNFPTAMITRKCGPALAVGCPVVIKPASDTPLSALALAVLAEEAGFPAGVFNVVTGGGSEVGAELAANPLVRKLTFTGSTEVGRQLMAECAPTLKKLSLELGGNAPFIVFDDADIEAAVEGAVLSKYRNAGQTCVCANRLLVQRGVHDRFAELLARRVESMQVGNGLDEGVSQGPLINEAAVQKVESLIADAVERGAQINCGGSRHPLGGTFFEPTILSNVTTEMACTREEIFGPVAPIICFDSEPEAIALANDTPYGLAAYFYTRDLGRTWRVSEALEYGIVGVNTGIISTEVAPFGGVKASGFGREGSKYGVEDYLEIKYVTHAGI